MVYQGKHYCQPFCTFFKICISLFAKMYTIEYNVIINILKSGGMMQDFGNYLKELRGNQSLRDVQKGTGISHSYLSTLERGSDPRTKKQRKPAPEILKKLATYYGVSYTDLLEKAGYIDLEADVEIRAEVTGELSVSTDLYTMLSKDRTVTFKDRRLTKNEKNKILIFIENILLK